MFLNKNKQQVKVFSESFSATDYSISKDEKGIVFPFSDKKDIDNEVICSSIINHKNIETCLIKHTEIRLVKCKNNVLTYQQIPTIGIEIMPNIYDSLKELFDNESSNFIMEVNIPNKELATKVNTDKLQPFVEIYNRFNTRNCIDTSLVKEKQKSHKYLSKDCNILLKGLKEDFPNIHSIFYSISFDSNKGTE